jgi:transposase-like protein
MSKQMKKYSSDFKLKIVLKYLSGNFTLYQICNEFDVGKSTLHKWVKQFKDNSSMIFNESLSKKSKKPQEGLITSKQADKLYTKIGQLTVERDFLKKVLDS